MCLRDASSRALPDGWKNRHGAPTCSQCLASVHNIRRHIHKLEEIQTSFMPSLKTVKSRLASLFGMAMSEHNDCELAVEQVKQNQDALDCIAILSCRKAMDVLVATNECTYRFFKCHSANCSQLLARKFRADNYLLCRSCKNAKTNAAVSQQRSKSIALNSKTNLRYLGPELLSQRGKLCYQERKRQERHIISLKKEVARLKDQIKRTEMVFDGSLGNAFLRDARDKAAPSAPPPARATPINHEDVDDQEHTQFLAELLTISKGITNNKELFSGLAKDVFLTILRQAYQNENLSNDLEFDEDDVTSMIDFMNEQLHNLVRMLTNKSSQSRFSPMTVQYAYGLWAESPAQLRASKAILPLVLPSERQLHKIKTQNKCEDGADIKAVQLLASSKNWEEVRHAIFYCDEMKVKTVSCGTHRLEKPRALRRTCSTSAQS